VFIVEQEMPGAELGIATGSYMNTVVTPTLFSRLS